MRLKLLLIALLPTLVAANPLLKGKAVQPEFLPVEQAFELQPAEWRDGRLLLSWRVTPGYYLYRDRFAFEASGPGLKLGDVTYPASKTMDDEIFGTVEVYDSDLRLPLSASGSGTFKVKYQGCAKAGLCYPPQTRELSIAAK